MKPTKILTPMAIIASFALASGTVQATGDDNPYTITSVPREMSYQGTLNDSGGNPVADSVYDVTFRIFNVASGGTSLWDETLPCTTSAGYFTATFSNVNLPFDEDYWLELEIGGEILDPRQKMCMVGYAAVSDTADYAERVGTVDGATGGTISGDVSIQSDLSVAGDISATGKATIGPGHTNTGAYAFVAGENNIASGDYATVGGGFHNRARGLYSVVSGGGGPTTPDSNAAIGDHSSIGGGKSNKASGDYSAVSGGGDNTAGGEWSAVAGGIHNTASASRSFVGGGVNNAANGPYSVVGGGYHNNTDGIASVIGGGQADTVNSVFGAILSGYYNTVGVFLSDSSAIIGGGSHNSATGKYSAILGGYSNTASEEASAIGGGSTNSVMGVYGGVSSGYSNLAGDNASDTAAFIAGGFDNSAIARGATIGGGYENTSSQEYTTVSGGISNSSSGDYATVGGGIMNTAGGGGGTTVAGGGYNLAYSPYSAVGGGAFNKARGQFSVVSGGGGAAHSDSNAAIGNYSTVPGGNRNIAGGNYSFAAGRRAKANHDGAFVWADQTNADFASTGPDQFLIRAAGGVGIGINDPDYKLDVLGTVGIDVGSNFGDVPLTIDVPSDQAALISRIAKGGSVINVVDNNGNVGIGTFSPQGALDVSSTTGAFIVPRMTSTQRDALTAVNGMIIYNTTTNQFNFYENGAWVTK